jgi:hypothetical protein
MVAPGMMPGVLFFRFPDARISTVDHAFGRVDPIPRAVYFEGLHPVVYERDASCRERP